MMPSMDDLAAFAAVARERSFTRAAAERGVSTSALSHRIKLLEAQLNVQLLVRTTRNVRPTEAGQHLLDSLEPALDNIGRSVSALLEQRTAPSGVINITTGRGAAMQVLSPMLADFSKDYPDISVEVTVEEGFRDIVQDGFDGGLRLERDIAQGMFSFPISRPVKAVIVAAPSYLEARGLPQAPADLISHSCIDYMMQTTRKRYAWEFEQDGRRFSIKTKAKLCFNDSNLIIDAALKGVGLAYVIEPMVAEHLAAGRLVSLLNAWCPLHPGFYFYHASRHPKPALAAFINALKARSLS